MKNKTLTKYSILILILIFGLIECKKNNNASEENKNNEELKVVYLKKEDLYFASGCDYSLIENYFIENGTKYGDSYIITSSSNTKSYSIKYIPTNKELQVVCGYVNTVRNTQTGYLFQYTYRGAIQVRLNQQLTQANYIGEYEFQSTSLSFTSSNGTYYNASLTFDKVQFVSLKELTDYKNIKCSGQIVYADNYVNANKAFLVEKNDIGLKCYQCINDALVYLNNLFIKIDCNYKIADKLINPNECNHIAIVDKGYDATCLENGLTDGEHCKVCNTVLVEQQIIPAGVNYHNYSNGECLFCHKLEPLKGLEFVLCNLKGYDRCYGIKSVGSCEDSCLVIPEIYNNLPVRVISSSAFKGNKLIEKVILYDNIISIGDNAFNDCSNLVDIILPETLEEIGNHAFYNCGYYNDSKNWVNNVLYIDNYLIVAKNEINGIYNVKEGTTLISNNAFWYCDDISEIILPDSVLYIGNSSFYHTSSLTSITISKKLIGVGNKAFDESNINSLSLPKTLCFYYHSFQIKNIYYEGTVSEWNKVSKYNESYNFAKVNCSNGMV